MTLWDLRAVLADLSRALGIIIPCFNSEVATRLRKSMMLKIILNESFKQTAILYNTSAKLKGPGKWKSLNAL